MDQYEERVMNAENELQFLKNGVLQKASTVLSVRGEPQIWGDPMILTYEHMCRIVRDLNKGIGAVVAAQERLDSAVKELAGHREAEEREQKIEEAKKLLNEAGYDVTLMVDGAKCAAENCDVCENRKICEQASDEDDEDADDIES